ncbi:hypothetical protein PilKf_00322 [Pillotina sp. SPG140]|jgi:hypothetical protein
MARVKDYIPTRYAEFDGWFESFIAYLLEKTGGTTPIWIHIPLALITALQAAYQAWHAAYEKTLGAHTPVETEAKNEEYAKAVALIRPFVAQYLKFDPVTNEDRTAMGLHNRDTNPSPIPPPSTRVVITDIRALGGFQVKIWFRDEQNAKSQAVPYGNNGCLLNYMWSTERLNDVSLLNKTVLMTRSPWTLTLPPESQATFLSCTTRWQNEKGELGPWSEVHHVVVA